jgi:hypothetical protein
VVHDFANDRDGENWELDEGPLIEGVDYEMEWLKARAVADALNRVFVRLGAAGPFRVQAGWAADGSGVVHLDGRTDEARRLVEALERVAERGQSR